jgi:ketosteroid isomerase-like protein
MPSSRFRRSTSSIRVRTGSIASIALLAACVSTSPAPSVDAESEMVAAEHAFAAAAARDGMREAFLAFADDSALAFDPEPAGARDVWRARPHSSGRLAWYPAFARVARSGDLGFTTGPYEAADSVGTVARYGEYVTVWRRTPTGWRFVVDLGSPHPRPVASAAEWRGPGRDVRSTWPTADTERVHLASTSASRKKDAERALLAADSGFAARAEAGGLAAALRSYGDVEMRLLRPRALPRMGLAAAVAAAAADGARRYKVRPARAFVSAAGDLGWTWGEYQWVHPGAGRRESGHYVRIWARGQEGGWRVLVDAVSPRPADRDE